MAPDISYLVAAPPIRILLVEGFDLRSGSQTVKVPSNIKHGQYYITRESVCACNHIYHSNL